MAVALAGSSSVEVAPGGTVMRLDDVDPEVTVFSDRPARLVGALGVEEFLALWNAGAFAGDPPNAVAVFGDSVTGVELLGAVWDPASRSLWLSVRPLDRVEGDEAGDADPIAKPTGVSSGPVQLFIDAFAVPANSQVTDAITQTNVKVLGEAPAEAMGELYESIGNSLGINAENASSQAQQLYVGATAATDEGVQKLLSVDTTG